MQKRGERIIETPVEARAGFLDRPVLVILVVGSMLAVLALGLSYSLIRASTMAVCQWCEPLVGSGRFGHNLNPAFRAPHPPA
jgi:hypothetical protein